MIIQRKELDELNIINEPIAKRRLGRKLKMELKERVKYLKGMAKKLEEGIYFVENQVLPRLEVDKNILSNVRKDLIKAEAELNAANNPSVAESQDSEVKLDETEGSKE